MYKFLNENPRPELADRLASLQTRQAMSSADASTVQPAAKPKESPPQPQTRNIARDFSGHGISALLVFGGADDVEDGVKARILARFDNATVVIYDAKNDPKGQDLTVRQVKAACSEINKTSGAVLYSPPCATFSAWQGENLRGQGKDIYGRPDLGPDAKIAVERANRLF